MLSRGTAFRAREGDVWQEKYDDGTVMFRYKNTPANFWSSNAWNLETNMFVGNFNENIGRTLQLIKIYVY